ncbi:MAG: thiol-disulfide oxidoreductase DCC family protein [Cyanothece sp. SIO1E1]|nr:thiol-disulfide oxidoreductase DCC family protein [Cyanothece sp. SIO1E1]
MYTVIYDGNCNLCATLVQFLEKLDQGKRFQYVPMQDQATLNGFGITEQDCEQGMILIDAAEPAKRWQGSDAVEEIGRLLPSGGLFINAYRALPGIKWAGDRIYEQVRDNRYTLFGQRDHLYQSTYPVCESDACQKMKG